MGNIISKIGFGPIGWKSIAVIAVLFAIAGIVGYLAVERADTPGARVAEAAIKVHRQVEDTKDEFASTQYVLEAVAQPDAVQESTSGGTGESAPARAAAPPAGGVPSVPGAPSSVNGNTASASGEDASDGNAKEIPNTTPTLNEQMNAIQEGPRTINQEAADRLTESWTPRFEAAVREQEALSERIRETRYLWLKYEEVQEDHVSKVNNPEIRAAMREALYQDQDAYLEWDTNAEHVERQAAMAVAKFRDMDNWIQFTRNRADFRALIGEQSLELSYSITSLLDSLETFETRTQNLSDAISG